MSARRAVESAAFAVAMRAKCGSLTMLEVDALRAQAEELLPEGTPLRLAVTAFATQFEAERFDPPRWIGLGDALTRAVELALRPDPVDAARRDIHG